MATYDTNARRSSAIGRSARTALVLLSRAGLVVSVLMLAAAPLAVSPSYSIVENTLSESGGQGVEGAWVLRTGVILAALSVLIMTTIASAAWSRPTRFAIRTYAIALVFLVVFPESAWDGRAFDPTVARLHTVAAVIGAIFFIAGVLSMSRSRAPARIGAKILDWAVVVAVAVVPQIMLFSSADGLWQRLMVAIGYVWLFVESLRMSRMVGDSFAPVEDAKI